MNNRFEGSKDGTKAVPHFAMGSSDQKSNHGHGATVTLKGVGSSDGRYCNERTRSACSSPPNDLTSASRFGIKNVDKTTPVSQLVTQPSPPEASSTSTLTTTTPGNLATTTPSRRSARRKTPSAKKKASIETERVFSHKKKSPAPTTQRAAIDISAPEVTTERRQDPTNLNKLASQNLDKPATENEFVAACKESFTSPYLPTTASKQTSLKPIVEEAANAASLPNSNVSSSPTPGLLQDDIMQTPPPASDDEDDLGLALSETPNGFFTATPPGATPPPPRRTRMRTPFAKRPIDWSPLETTSSKNEKESKVSSPVQKGNSRSSHVVAKHESATQSICIDDSGISQQPPNKGVSAISHASISNWRPNVPSKQGHAATSAPAGPNQNQETTQMAATIAPQECETIQSSALPVAKDQLESAVVSTKHQQAPCIASTKKGSELKSNQLSRTATESDFVEGPATKQRELPSIFALPTEKFPSAQSNIPAAPIARSTPPSTSALLLRGQAAISTEKESAGSASPSIGLSQREPAPFVDSTVPTTAPAMTLTAIPKLQKSTDNTVPRSDATPIPSYAATNITQQSETPKPCISTPELNTNAAQLESTVTSLKRTTVNGPNLQAASLSTLKKKGSSFVLPPLPSTKKKSLTRTKHSTNGSKALDSSTPLRTPEVAGPSNAAASAVAGSSKTVLSSQPFGRIGIYSTPQKQTNSQSSTPLRRSTRKASLLSATKIKQQVSATKSKSISSMALEDHFAHSQSDPQKWRTNCRPSLDKPPLAAISEDALEVAKRSIKDELNNSFEKTKQTPSTRRLRRRTLSSTTVSSENIRAVDSPLTYSGVVEEARQSDSKSTKKRRNTRRASLSALESQLDGVVEKFESETQDGAIVCYDDQESRPKKRRSTRRASTSGATTAPTAKSLEDTGSNTKTGSSNIPTRAPSLPQRRSRRASLSVGNSSTVQQDGPAEKISTGKDSLDSATSNTHRNNRRASMSPLTVDTEIPALSTKTSLLHQESRDYVSNRIQASSTATKPPLSEKDLNTQPSRSAYKETISSKALGSIPRRSSRRKSTVTTSTSMWSTKRSGGSFPENCCSINQDYSSKKRRLFSETGELNPFGLPNLNEDESPATIIRAWMISKQAQQLFSNTAITEEPCVSARIFACYTLVQAFEKSSAVQQSCTTQGNWAVPVSSEIQPLMSFLKALVRVEMTSLEDQDDIPGSNSIKSNRRVHFSGFDCSSTKPPVDAKMGSHNHQQDCISALTLAAQQQRSLVSQAHSNSENQDSIAIVGQALQAIIAFLKRLSHCTVMLEECAWSISENYPPKRLQKAIEMYQHDFEAIYSRLPCVESNGHPTSTYLEWRLAEFVGQSIRFHLRRLFNPPPLSYTRLPEGTESPPRPPTPKDPALRQSRIHELVELELPSPSRDSAVADGSISSLFSVALSRIYVYFGMEAFVTALTKDSPISVPESFCTSPSSMRGLGTKKDPAAPMTPAELEELLGDIDDVYNFLSAYKACKFLMELMSFPGVKDEVVRMGGWAKVEYYAKIIRQHNLGSICTEDAHFSVLGYAGSMERFFNKIEDWASQMEPKVPLAQISIDQLAKRYRTKTTSPKQLRTLHKRFPHIKTIAAAINEGNARATSFPKIVNVSVSSSPETL